MNHRAEIDGLRAIAVVSVILYHAQIVIFGRDWFEGGFIGVDIFFVISGYLITRIILNELEERNTFSFLKFYERRARRILPMLLVVISVCIPFAWQKLLPLDLVDFAKSALSAIGFGSNFFFYFSTTEYGADSALLKPLLHTWSLGVEEQFYIFVPIIIFIFWKIARASLLTLLIGMLIISIQFADVMQVQNSELNFFLPFTRFWELLVGSALAFIELKYGRSKNTILRQTLPIVGLFLIVHSILFFDAKTPHPSFQTLIPVLGVALVLVFCSTEEPVGKLLSFKPIVGIGLISYSLYLWHFPIFAFGRISSPKTSNFDKLEWIALALTLSTISYYLIERTFRNQKLVNRKWFFLILLTSISSLIYVNYDFISKHGYKDRLPPILSKKGLDIKDWKEYKIDGVPCYNRSKQFCLIEHQKDLTLVHLNGDSHLAAIASSLRKALASNYNYAESNMGGCPFILGMNKVPNVRVNERCNPEFQLERLNLISNSQSIVVIGGRFPLYLSLFLFDNKEGGIEGGKWKNSFIFNNDLNFEEAFKNTVDGIVASGQKVVLVYPIPEVGINVPNYVFNKMNEANSLIDIGKINEVMMSNRLTTSYEVYKERSASTFELFDSIKSPNIFRVYPHNLFCDTQVKGRCITYNDTDVFYADADHPSLKGSEMIVELIMDQIERAEAQIRGK